MKPEIAPAPYPPHPTVPPLASPLLQSIQGAPDGLGLAQLLALHPDVSRRTAQRLLAGWVAGGHIVAVGQARARRYVASAQAASANRSNAANLANRAQGTADHFPATIPLSADSRDVLDYVDQPLSSRKPVGYQRDFLQAYEPNLTWYLPAPLRRQLHNMGHTAQAGEPAGTYSRAILNRLLIDLSWASSQLEGNTYSRLDTRALIEHGQVAHGKAATETQMILNHKTAIEWLVESVERQGSASAAGFDRYTLLNLHAALSENLLPNPADEGRVRQHIVEIGKSVFRPLSVPQQIDEALAMLLTKASQIGDPFEQAFFMLVHVPYLQPFADINKRTSRLIANLPLFRANLCPLTFVDVPEAAYSRAVLGVYELTRVELLRDVFVWAYERSTQEYLAIKQDLAEPDPVRLAYRDVIKQTVHAVVMRPGEDAMPLMAQAVAARVPEPDRAAVLSITVDELRRLHEGVLARYGLRPSEFAAWKAQAAD
ncbi:Fic family protein [Acidovorax sp. 106]|uniref:Fic family protein n=1 Tax=Acidovorax sp. 106 TaxID=2135637 RepID=UPI000EB1285A|nr:Fic family protein [Acidovorax sp. 106]RLJ37594.1 Fic/DOC family protein [Acidovorax sp. 106]